MNLHLIKYLSLSALCAAATGCVNYDTATQQEVYFYSEDTPAVTVSVNGELVGETTCSTLLERSNSYSVVFTKEGYKSATYELNPFEDPDTGIIGFIDEVYCPELEPETEDASAEVAVPAEPVLPAADDTEEPAADEPAETTEIPDEETPADATEEFEDAPETPITEAPEVDESVETAEEPADDATPPAEDKPEVVSEEADSVHFRTMTELQAELTELKRQRKLNLISAEEFEKRTNALIEEVSRTY